MKNGYPGWQLYDPKMELHSFACSIPLWFLLEHCCMMCLSMDDNFGEWVESMGVASGRG